MMRQRFIQSSKNEGEVEFVSLEKSKQKKFSAKWILKLIVFIILILYVVVPFSFYLSPSIRTHAVFLHYLSLSRNRNLTFPSGMGLNCTRNFYVESENGIQLGVWHVPPKEALSKCKDGDHVPEKEEFSDERPVFLYLHGNSGSRGGTHRIQLYKVLSEKLNAHTVAFDYRGYGDSSNESPSESAVVADTLHVYNWLRKRVDASRIFIWGHSLGTGVSVAFIHSLTISNEELPSAVILEAPFTSIIDCAKHHPISFLHRHMPFFNFFFADPIGEEGTAFNSLSRIEHITCPLLILHAEDDGFVPYHHGKKLYDRALTARQNYHPHSTQFVGFEKKFNYGHKNIYKSPALPDILKTFMDNIKVLS